MNFVRRRFGKRGHIVPNELIKWILYLFIAVAAVFVIKNIVGKFGG